VFVSLSRFYARRAARLVPALLLVVAFCDLVFLLQDDLRAVRGSVFALTYTANYAIALQPGSVPGFDPTWSLAVEEHFYIVWPLVLTVVVGRWKLRAGAAVTLAICAIALSWRAGLVLADRNRELIATGSVERADAIMWGCFAALVLRRGWRPPAGTGWAGLAVLACLPIVFSDFYGPYTLTVGNAVLAVAGTALVVGLDFNHFGVLQRVLSLRPLVALGVLSYGVYLWHQPLFRIAENAGFEGRWWRTLVSLLSIGFAAASYRWVEAPVRAWARRRTSGAGTIVAAPVIPRT
jgi:peptidoglycan/LPS O-acetylase OafA/YrhL